MKFLTKTAQFIALGAFFIGGLTATAQTITPGTGSASCQVAPTATGLTYTLSGATLVRWEVLGDLAIAGTSSETANPVVINSTGYGKGIVRAVYSGCSAVSYPVYKSFSAPDAIEGPTNLTCIQAGNSNVYYVPPVVSTTAQINSGAGVDTYVWSIDPATAASFTTNTSGEGNSIKVVPNGSVASFQIIAQVGQCNTLLSQKRTLTVNVLPTVLVQPSATSASSYSCRPTSDVTSPFTLTVTNPVAGIVYTWSKPPTWSISSTTGTSVTIVPDGNAGDVSVKAGNNAGCVSDQSTTFSLSRQLVPTTTGDFNKLVGAPACYTAGTDYPLTIQNAPGNSLFTWTVPAGFTGNGQSGTFTNSSPTLIVRGSVGAAQGVLSVTTSTCTGAAGTVTTPLRVNGTNNCTLSLVDNGCGQFQVTSQAGCLSNVTGSPTIYYWTATGYANQTRTGLSTVLFDGEVTGTVTVRAVNAARCFDSGIITFNGPFTPCPQLRHNTTGGATGTQQLGVFPNPAGEKLNVDLPLVEGATYKLTLLDALGRTKLQTSTTQAHSTLNVGKLATGVYTLQATLPNGKMLSQRVVIER